MKFRHHRSTLSESMATVTNVDGLEDLANLIRSTYPDLKGDVVVSKYSIDTRIGWDTYLVSIGGNAVGFTDGPAN